MNFDDAWEMISEAARKTRSDYHLTLGELWDLLEDVPDDYTIPVDGCHSYRGYYEDLALSVNQEQKWTVAAVRMVLGCALNGEVFTGYKGGEYVMDQNTPLWLAEWGKDGRAILDLEIDHDEKTVGLVVMDIREVF